MSPQLLFFAATALQVVLTALAFPKVIVAIGRNRWVGLQAPVMRTSDEAWARGHQLAWPATWGGFIVGVAVGIFGFAASRQTGEDTLLTMGLTLQIVIWIVSTLVGAGRANRALLNEQQG